MKGIFAFFIFLTLFCSGITVAQTYKDVLIQRAEAGDLGSQKYLANAYLNGKGSYAKNQLEAYNWMSKAASQGDAEAQYAMYIFHKDGIGCEKMVDIDNLFASSEQKFPPAMLELGIILSQMLGKEIEGRTLLIEAYNLGEVSALPMIGTNYACAGEFANAEKYYKKAIEECTGYDQANSFRGLALLYGEGLEVEKNLKEAHRLIDRAISIFPTDPSFYDYKGGLYLEQGNMKEATNMWNKVVETSLSYAMECKSDLARAMNHSIDFGIPVSNSVNNNTYALIIANENYKRVPNVPHAINDGKIFYKYVTSTFGISEKNIEYLEDATLNDIKYAINNMKQRCGAFPNQKNILIYYAGHGVPDEKTNEAYLLPVDGFGTDPSSGLKMEDFYENLSQMPAKSVIVLLDACFSGAKRDGGMLMATRGITIKPNIKVPDGKLIVLSATSDDQTAFPIEEQKHGLFTYTLLRKIQETNGDITWGELADHVTETVKSRSIDLNGKLQTPTVSVSTSMKEIWRNIPLR